MNRSTFLILLTSLTSLTYAQELVPVAITEGDDLFVATVEPTASPTEAPSETTGEARIPNDPEAVSFINLIQSNILGPNCLPEHYGIEIAYSESFTGATLTLYDGWGTEKHQTAEFDLVGNETTKQFHGIEFSPDEWTTVMYIEFASKINGEKVVHQLIHFGVSGADPSINGVESLEVSRNPLVKGDMSFVFRDNEDTPAEGGWVRKDFGWENDIGNGECFWEKANSGQTIRGEEGGTTTTTAAGGPSGSVTHSAGLAVTALLSLAGMM